MPFKAAMSRDFSKTLLQIILFGENIKLYVKCENFNRARPLPYTVASQHFKCLSIILILVCIVRL